MSSLYRVVDDGYMLTVGKVTYDLNGEPVTVQLNVLEATSLTGLIDIISQIKIALKAPVLSLQESGCEVI